jgi:uncharacterized protein YjbJ (UPF0337 family)
MLNQEQINGKWSEIKGGVRNLWRDISEEELDQVKGNIQSVSGIVQQHYSESKESIKKKLENLMDTFDNETDKSLKLNDGEASYQRSPTGVRTSQVSQNQDTMQDIRTRSPERAQFDATQGADIIKEDDVDPDSDDEYNGEEIFDNGDKEDPTYQPKQ